MTTMVSPSKALAPPVVESLTNRMPLCIVVPAFLPRLRPPCRPASSAPIPKYVPPLRPGSAAYRKSADQIPSKRRRWEMD